MILVIGCWVVFALLAVSACRAKKRYQEDFIFMTIIWGAITALATLVLLITIN